MKKNLLEEELKKAFFAGCWQFERVAGLPAAFVLSTLVTPFFQPRLLSRSKSSYLIDGYVGVLHRGFEARWVESKREYSKHNFHCLALNIANFSLLRSRQYVTLDTYDGDIPAFSDAVVRLLNMLPHDEAALRSAFEAGILMDIPLEKFVIPIRTEKLTNLKIFLDTGQLSLSH
jgi:hypothetical protein